jgi:DNA-binding NtrC family response regulator
LSKETPSRGRVTIAQDTQQALMAHSWPGNVRQLENVMERAFALSPGRAQLELADLQEDIRGSVAPLTSESVAFSAEGVDFGDLVAQFEHALIRRALEHSGGNKRVASDLLKIKRTTLIEKLKRLERS